jgi:hypothetical protein
VIDPSSFPIDFGLHRCEPRVTEYGFVFTEVGQEESQRVALPAIANLEICVKLEFSALVLGSIDVIEFSRLWKLFDWEF